MSNASTPIRRGYFDGPTGQVHYRRCRIEGGEPLLLMHQSPLSSTQFEAVMPALAASGFDVLATDMPGFGMSDVAPEGATLEDFASIISAGFAAMGWRSAAIVGHHTGAVLASVFAAAHPAAVKKLVLNGFPLLGKAERDHFATFYFGPKEPKADGTHLLNAGLDRHSADASLHGRGLASGREQLEGVSTRDLRRSRGGVAQDHGADAHVHQYW
jgi:pimeloyl-ACP methyl ester carboxylesterase